jgi:hypothetical protein
VRVQTAEDMEVCGCEGFAKSASEGRMAAGSVTADAVLKRGLVAEATEIVIGGFGESL